MHRLIKAGLTGAIALVVVALVSLGAFLWDFFRVAPEPPWATYRDRLVEADRCSDALDFLLVLRGIAHMPGLGLAAADLVDTWPCPTPPRAAESASGLSAAIRRATHLLGSSTLPDTRRAVLTGAAWWTAPEPGLGRWRALYVSFVRLDCAARYFPWRADTDLAWRYAEDLGLDAAHPGRGLEDRRMARCIDRLEDLLASLDATAAGSKGRRSVAQILDLRRIDARLRARLGSGT